MNVFYVYRYWRNIIPAALLAIAVLCCREASAQPEPQQKDGGESAFDTGDFQWRVGQPLLSVDADRLPASDEHPWIAVKDPSIVRHDDRWHLFCTLRKQKEGDGRIRIGYLSFSDWSQAKDADWSVLNLTMEYHGAPQIFYFRPHRKWYLIYQAADSTRGLKYGPCYSTNDDLSRPDQWTLPEPLYVVPEGTKAGLDFWVICDETKAHLFFTSLNGQMWRAETLLSNFPSSGWSKPQVALQADIFEASHTYKLKGQQRYFTIVEAQADRRRYFKGFVADSLDGQWTPLAASREKPLVSPLNVVNQDQSWATSYSHGEFLRTGFDERLEIDPAHAQLLFQGADDKEYRQNYGNIPWRLGILEAASPTAQSKPLSRIRVSDDRTHFVLADSNEPFRIWGVNYDHDSEGQLLDEYWTEKWPTVVEDFGEIKDLGANCVRIHLQLGKFMRSPQQADEAALHQLSELLRLAEQTGLYLDITGLACYHKQNIPPWYDQLDESARWDVQANFWRAIARTCQGSPAVFCYDLMNEPILPGKNVETEWLGGELGGKFFVQRLSLDAQGRDRKEIAAAWVNRMSDAIRSEDSDGLITVGVIPWVFSFGGGKPVFYSPEVGGPLDFVSVHFYPKQGEIDAAITALQAYEVGKPLVVEEMFPLKSGIDELEEFVRRSSSHTDGWISFYWGATAEQLANKPDANIGEAITAQWLERFQSLAPDAKQGTLDR